MHIDSPKYVFTLVPVFFLALALLSCVTPDSSVRLESAQYPVPGSANTKPSGETSAAYRAHAFYARGDLQGAVTVLEEAIQSEPDDAQLHFVLANAYYRQQHWDQAVEEYQQAARLRPRHPDTYLNLGYALYRADQVDQATSAWYVALQQSPGDALMHLSLAVGLNKQGQNHRASQHVARAIVVDTSWQQRLSIDMRWTADMVNEINSLVSQLEGT